MKYPMTRKIGLHLQEMGDSGVIVTKVGAMDLMVTGI